jgi:hypothetical protein
MRKLMMLLVLGMLAALGGVAAARTVGRAGTKLESVIEVGKGSDRLSASAAPEFRAGVGGIDACYVAALKSDPTMTGSATIDLWIGPKGDVEKVEAKSTDTGVANCARRVAATWSFGRLGASEQVHLRGSYSLTLN